MIDIKIYMLRNVFTVYLNKYNEEEKEEKRDGEEEKRH